MAEIILKNEQLEIEVKLHGAELCSLKDVESGIQYLWNADPKYWGRTSPVLFPFVGSVRDKKFKYNGTEYPMNQHGFARDMDFVLISREDDEAWFALESTKERYQRYPFRFRLEIGYRIEENTVTVMWRVKNTDEKEMYFSIGAHPAFFCPLKEGEKQSDYYLAFWKKDGSRPEMFCNTVFGQGGLVTADKKDYALEDGVLPIAEDLFDGDALVIENHQVQRVALLDGKKGEYLAVEFDAPLVGIWSPPKKQAPFVCIEPWYGRCDKEGFNGELKDREWGNTLEPGGEFAAEYRIIIKR